MNSSFIFIRTIFLSLFRIYRQASILKIDLYTIFCEIKFQTFLDNSNTFNQFLLIFFYCTLIYFICVFVYIWTYLENQSIKLTIKGIFVYKYDFYVFIPTRHLEFRCIVWHNVTIMRSHDRAHAMNYRTTL